MTDPELWTITALAASSLIYPARLIRRRVMRWPAHLRALWQETAFSCLRPLALMTIALGWAGTSWWFGVPPATSGWLYSTFGPDGVLIGILLFTALMFGGSLAFIVYKIRRFLHAWRTGATKTAPASVQHPRHSDFGPPDFS